MFLLCITPWTKSKVIIERLEADSAMGGDAKKNKCWKAKSLKFI